MHRGRTLFFAKAIRVTRASPARLDASPKKRWLPMSKKTLLLGAAAVLGQAPHLRPALPLRRRLGLPGGYAHGKAVETSGALVELGGRDQLKRGVEGMLHEHLPWLVGLVAKRLRHFELRAAARRPKAPSQ